MSQGQWYARRRRPLRQQIRVLMCGLSAKRSNKLLLPSCDKKPGQFIVNNDHLRTMKFRNTYCIVTACEANCHNLPNASMVLAELDVNAF